MDTSEKYIEMCEKAQEVQKLNKKEKSDIFISIPSPYNINSNEIFYYGLGGFAFRKHYHFDKMVWSIDEGRTTKYFDKELLVWLPRQDQLQEMITIENMGKLMIPLTTFNSFNYFVMSDWTLFKSLECYWLAFVMKENFNKIWDIKRKEWIAINV